jgi:DNA-binding transcriptional regulator YhcF (GntR family)
MHNEKQEYLNFNEIAKMLNINRSNVKYHLLKHKEICTIIWDSKGRGYIKFQEAMDLAKRFHEKKMKKIEEQNYGVLKKAINVHIPFNQLCELIGKEHVF